MTIEVTYSQTRKELASLLDDVTQDKEMVIINRRGGKPAALRSMLHDYIDDRQFLHDMRERVSGSADQRGV